MEAKLMDWPEESPTVAVLPPLPVVAKGGHAKLDRRISTRGLNLVLLAALLVSIVAASCIGAVRLPVAEVLEAFLHPTRAGQAAEIIFALRLPRILAAALVGAALSATGVLFQG